jgi:hypothetical protein
MASIRPVSVRVPLGFRIYGEFWPAARPTDSPAPDDTTNANVILRVLDGGTLSLNKDSRDPYTPGPDWLLGEAMAIIICFTENSTLLEDSSFPIIKNVNPTLYISDERFFNKPPTAVGSKKKLTENVEPKVEISTGFIEEL